MVHALNAAAIVGTSIAQMRYDVMSVMTVPAVRYTAVKFIVSCRKSCWPFALAAKFACTTGFGLDAKLTVHKVDVPRQAPLQPLKVDPLVGMAVSVMADAVGYAAEQDVGQVIRVSFEVTDPVPVPATLTVSVRSRSNIAFTVGFC